jgi:hypothetical protein
VAVTVDHWVLQPVMYLCRSIFHGHLSSLGQTAEKEPYASLRSTDFASTYKKSTPSLIDLRAPRLWIFLSSLQEVFFSNLLRLLKCSIHQE